MGDNMVRKFVSAAIQFFDDNGQEIIMTGKRHHQIIADIHDKGYEECYKRCHNDGFIVEYSNNGQSIEVFKDRNISTQIAKNLGIEMQSSILTSEDLW